MKFAVVLALVALLVAVPVQVAGAKPRSSAKYLDTITLTPSKAKTGVVPQLALAVCQGTSDNPHKSVTIPGEVDAIGRTYCPVSQLLEYVESWLYEDGIQVDHRWDAESRPNGTAQVTVATGCISGTHVFQIVSLHSVTFLDGSTDSGFTSSSATISCGGPYAAQ